MTDNLHKTVLLKEAVSNLALADNSVVADLTLGGGGHSVEIVRRVIAEKVSEVTLLCIDFDYNSWVYFQKKLADKSILYDVAKEDEIHFGDRCKVVFKLGNFVTLGTQLNEIFPTGYNLVGVLADLGPSQNLLEDAGRGLSFRMQSPLDMRLGEDLAVTAADLLNALSKKQLRRLFTDYADLKYSLSLAERIVDVRAGKQVATVNDLNEIVISVLRKQGRYETSKLQSGITAGKQTFSRDVARELAKVYQALRIAVNLEYQNLEEMLGTAWSSLTKGGKLAVITFHSGEEKVLKQTISAVPAKIVIPTRKEIQENPRSRSAKLYVYTR